MNIVYTTVVSTSVSIWRTWDQILLLPFRSLGSYVHSTLPPFTEQYLCFTQQCLRSLSSASVSLSSASVHSAVPLFHSAVPPFTQQFLRSLSSACFTQQCLHSFSCTSVHSAVQPFTQQLLTVDSGGYVNE